MYIKDIKAQGMGVSKINPYMARHLGNSESQITGVMTDGIMTYQGLRPDGKKKEKYTPFNESKAAEIAKQKEKCKF